MIDGIYSMHSIYVPAGHSLTVKNSRISYINDEGSSLLVENTTINGGGQWEYAAIDGGANITVENSNLYNAEHGVLCYGNCTVENNYIHDNANGSAAGAHQDGFLSVNGSHFTVEHNSVGCVGGCTGDISFLDQSTNSSATVSKNLLIASPDAAFCAYPGPDNPGQRASKMVWTDNVFQKGPHNKCATYSPVYGWYPQDGPGNVWSGNTWDDGTPLNEP
jgi:Right handed beta helix region